MVQALVVTVERGLQRLGGGVNVATLAVVSIVGCFGYGAIKNILRKGLDLEALPTVVVPSLDPTERPRFARNVQELLDFTLEDHDASH